MIYAHQIRTMAVIGVILCAAIVARAIAAPPGYRAGEVTALQMLTMPKFCWWEFDARYAQTQQLIRDCGVAMNHYCSGEVSFIKSRDVTKSQSERLVWLGRALADVEYTLQGMKNYPACSIRGPVTKRYNEIRASYLRLGRPMPPNILAPPPK